MKNWRLFGLRILAAHKLHLAFVVNLPCNVFDGITPLCGDAAVVHNPLGHINDVLSGQTLFRAKQTQMLLILLDVVGTPAIVDA